MSRKSLLLTVAGIVLALAALYAAAWFKARSLVDEQLQQLVASGSYEKADYASLWLSPLRTLTLGELELKQPDFDLVVEQLSVSDIDFFHAPPHHLAITARGLRFPQGLPDLSATSPLLATLLRSVSHDDTVLATIEYSYDTAANDANRTLYTIALSLPNLAELRVDAEALHWLHDASPASLMSANTATGQVQTPGDAAVPRATLSLHDSGVVSIFLQAMAEDSHTSIADARAVLTSQLRNADQLLPANLRNLALTGGAELAKFLDGNKTLTLTITPVHDGNIALLQQELMGAVLTGNYDQVAALLQLKIATD
ncbi:MAG TPA: hypothetical protein VMH83_01075 [Candidatus Acidoferrum sp.]|nr:hypothetical protein [Candidatus Acidoferrum sp.]